MGHLGRRHSRKATRLFKPAGERRLLDTDLFPELARTDRVLPEQPANGLRLKRWREWPGHIVIDSSPPRSNEKSRQLSWHWRGHHTGRGPLNRKRVEPGPLNRKRAEPESERSRVG